MELLARLEAIEQSDMGLANICEHSLSLIRKALDIYGPEGMAFSFNGGKDSCLALHLMRLAMAQRLMKKYDDDVHMVTEEMFNEEFGKIHMINFFDPDNFEEMDQFIDDQVEKYKLNLRIYKCGFKQGLEKVIEEKGCRAFVLGVRRDDPSGATLEHFYPSSDGWPAFLRVCPILCWKYAEVWRFLRSCELDYCHLYDQGYTSLGSKSTTMPNPLLKQEDGSYSPAYKLEDASSERGGRYVKKTKVCSPSPEDGNTDKRIMEMKDEFGKISIQKLNENGTETPTISRASSTTSNVSPLKGITSKSTVNIKMETVDESYEGTSLIESSEETSTPNTCKVSDDDSGAKSILNDNDNNNNNNNNSIDPEKFLMRSSSIRTEMPILLDSLSTVELEIKVNNNNNTENNTILNSSVDSFATSSSSPLSSSTTTTTVTNVLDSNPPAVSNSIAMNQSSSIVAETSSNLLVNSNSISTPTTKEKEELTEHELLYIFVKEVFGEYGSCIFQNRF